MNDVPQRTAAPSALAAGLAVCLLVAGCSVIQGESDQDTQEAASTEEPPPLDEPTDDPATTAASDDEPAAETGDIGEDVSDGSANGGAGAQESAENGVLDVTEFSAERQQSHGFPELLTDVPEDSHLLLQEVRVGIHEGYHRIVFEHSGAGAPGWSAEYVEDAVELGSGFPIDMESDSLLYIGVVGLEPDNAGEGDGHLELEDFVDTQGTVFAEAVTTFVHHGSASYYVGLDAEREFRVSVWEHPNGPRLIIDVLV